MSRATLNKFSVARFIPLLVATSVFAVFLPALKDGFLNWDDIYNLVDNKKYQGLGWEQLKWIFTAHSLGPYTPLTWITSALDYVVWGMNPIGFHLTNIILHSVTALAFYFLCVKLLSLARQSVALEKNWVVYISAGFATLFFALHPLRVESVSWLSGRHDILTTLFYLLGIYFYVSTHSPDVESAPFWRRYLLPLGAFLLALLAKGMAISLPLALLILDVYPLRRLGGGPGRWFSREVRAVWMEKIPFFALAVVFGAAGYMFQTQTGNTILYQYLSLSQRVAHILFNISFYVQKTLFPYYLSPIYRFPEGFGLYNLRSIVSGVAIGGVTAVALLCRRRWQAISAAWFFYLAALSPVSGIVKVNTYAAADRYAYLPCLGFAILAGAGLRTSLLASNARVRVVCLILAGLLLAGLATLTWKQEGVWRDSETLWKYALTVDPKLDYAYNNLGIIMEKRGEIGPASNYYNEALKINPKNAQAHNNIAEILAAQGKPELAVNHYLEALKINPAYAEAHYNLAMCLAQYGNVYGAAIHYRQALALSPDMANAHNNLAGILAAQGMTEEAIMHCREALKINPDLAEAHSNLAGILAAQGKLAEAENQYREVLRIKPDSAGNYMSLGGILAMQGKTDEAMKVLLNALQLDPNMAAAHYNLSLVLSAKGIKKQAAEHYREALRINPNIVAPPRRQEK